MEGLYNSVLKGVYAPIPNFYSKELSNVIKMMLQLKPSNRPGTERLLKSSLLTKKSAETGFDPYFKEENHELLKTIRVPKRLHYLTDRLPKSNY